MNNCDSEEVRGQRSMIGRSGKFAKKPDIRRRGARIRNGRSRSHRAKIRASIVTPDPPGTTRSITAE